MSDFEATRKKRMEALEEKRKRLDEMKRSRTEKAQLNQKLGASATSEGMAEIKSETDALVSELLTQPLPEGVEAAAKPQISAAERSKTFTRVKLNFNINIEPATKMTYPKETQVEPEDALFMSNDDDEEMSKPSTTPKKTASSSQAQTGSKEETKFGGMRDSGLMKTLVKKAKEDEVQKAKILTHDEYLKAVAKPNFKKFLGKVSLYVDRALDQTDSMDVIRDFSAKVEKKVKSKAFNIAKPYEEDSLNNRPIMDLKYSELVPQIFLTAYGAKATAKNTNMYSSAEELESPGLVCIWSKDLHRYPEMKFNAPSPVMTACFHSSDEHIVFGGCYSGQILAWDMKEGKNAPSQRSSMSGKGHKQPVYAMAMANSAVSNELISVSTDGMLCHWDVNRLQEPLVTMMLNYPSPQASIPGHYDLGDSEGRGPLNVCSMCFQATDTSPNIIFGTGSGQVFRSELPYKPSTPPLNEINAHMGLVTSIQPHVDQSKSHKQLLLTSSLDWTVKLWNVNNLSKPIFEFFSPTYDYVCDVKWSPSNPAIFATITSGGKLSLWNLTKSTTSAVDEINLTEIAAEKATSGGSIKRKGQATRTLNKISWAPDGASILIGDSLGTVHLAILNQSQIASNAAEEEKFEMFILTTDE